MARLFFTSDEKKSDLMEIFSRLTKKISDLMEIFSRLMEIFSDLMESFSDVMEIFSGFENISITVDGKNINPENILRDLAENIFNCEKITFERYLLIAGRKYLYLTKIFM